MEDSFYSSSIDKSSMAAESRKEAEAETETETPEESGWTSYFEDFLATQQRDDLHGHSFNHHDRYHHHNHLVSDAASYVEWKSSNSTMTGGSPKFSKKLSLIKKTGRRTREVPYDDSLEDTASSPVNSPKVGDLKEMGFNQRKTDDTIESSLGKEGGCDNHLQLQKTNDQRKELAFGEKINNECTDLDLRKKGLCLVPVSMLVNYLR